MTPPRIPRRFRRPKADLRLDSEPPATSAGSQPTPPSPIANPAANNPGITAAANTADPELVPGQLVRLQVNPEAEEANYAETGQLVRLQVKLLPLEPFQIRRGRLCLSLLTTRFARTVLDGYHEHTSEKVYQTAILCENAAAHTGNPLLYSAELYLPDTPPPDSRPVRQQWQAKAKFEIAGYRPLQAARPLHDTTPQPSNAPIVDGRGFLPL